MNGQVNIGDGVKERSKWGRGGQGNGSWGQLGRRCTSAEIKEWPDGESKSGVGEVGKAKITDHF